jgi:hypothetical protein
LRKCNLFVIEQSPLKTSSSMYFQIATLLCFGGDAITVEIRIGEIEGALRVIGGDINPILQVLAPSS